MFGLMLLGLLHTPISLIAVAAGPIALVRYKQISSKHRVGKVYVVTTIVTRNADAAALQVVAAALFIATTLQVRRLRAKRPQQA
jgi:hypothetical protein